HEVVHRRRLVPKAHRQPDLAGGEVQRADAVVRGMVGRQVLDQLEPEWRLLDAGEGVGREVAGKRQVLRPTSPVRDEQPGRGPGWADLVGRAGGRRLDERRPSTVRGGERGPHPAGYRTGVDDLAERVDPAGLRLTGRARID